jgi:hypothetical protein
MSLGITNSPESVRKEIVRHEFEKSEMDCGVGV